MIYPDSRNNLSLETPFISEKWVVKLGDMNMAKRSKHETKAKARAIKLTPSKEHLSSKDFLKKADKLWREGPKVKYKYSDAWQRALD
jgi:hypothetical protein